MAEKPITPKLDEAIELKNLTLDYLRKHPGNLAATAKHFKLTNAQMLELRNQFLHEFKLVEEEHLDRMVELCTLDALGQLGKDQFPDFNFNKAWKFLERRRSNIYGSTTAVMNKAKETDTAVTPSNGKAEEMLKEYERRKGTLRPGDWNQ